MVSGELGIVCVGAAPVFWAEPAGRWRAGGGGGGVLGVVGGLLGRFASDIDNSPVQQG